MCFPTFCSSPRHTSALLSPPSIMNHQRPSSLHSHQTLALLQMRIDPSANLISTILSRAFSFTALHSATQTRLSHGVVWCGRKWIVKKKSEVKAKKKKDHILKSSWKVFTHSPVKLEIHPAEQPRIDCTNCCCWKQIVNESNCLLY